MESPKQYLYHMVPKDMRSDEEGRHIIYPLNMLREKFPDLHEVKIGKYESEDERRKSVPNRLVHTLENAAWGDVIQLTAIHPNELKKALNEAGLHPKDMKFYQIDPESLDPEKTRVFLYRDDVDHDDAENYSAYDPGKVSDYSAISDRTKAYYKESAECKERPLLFVGVPHIFHKGPIDVSNFPIITAE